MYCTNCGRQIKSDAKFCSACGNPISNTLPEKSSGAGTNLDECKRINGDRSTETLDNTQEILLARLTHIKASDVPWGGFLELYLTNKRIILVFVSGPGTAIAASLAAGFIGSMIVSKHADKKGEQMYADAKSLDQILASSPKNYAINYNDITDISMKRRALPIGYSRAEIRTRNRKVSYAFERKWFDDVLRVLKSVLPKKIEVK